MTRRQLIRSALLAPLAMAAASLVYRPKALGAGLPWWQCGPEVHKRCPRMTVLGPRADSAIVGTDYSVIEFWSRESGTWQLHQRHITPRART
jgi:hypothetical protein